MGIFFLLIISIFLVSYGLFQEIKIKDELNQFHATDLFLYLLKILENLWFSDVFRGYRKRPVT